MTRRSLGLLALLVLAACNRGEPGEEVRILRDDYGVPHVYADTVYGLFYGYGYAVAQDRLFQMEMARRSTQGTVAEALGPDYVDYDATTRQHFDPRSIRAQLDALDERHRDVFDGYAAGMNAWLAEVRKEPGRWLPRQFTDFGIAPADWTAYDVAMIFVGTMMNRYGDFNTEHENAEILDALVAEHGEERARALFDLLNPRFTDDAPTTIPRADWTVTAPDPLAEAPPKAAGTHSGDFPASATTTGASNVWLIGRAKAEGAAAILVNGPQFGWFLPSYVYSVGLHGAGFDVVGNTPFAYPVIMFGHNPRIGWGSTWGASDIVDLYAESLAPDHPTRYLYQGKYRDFDHRAETVRVKGGPDVALDVYRSVHGPVVHVDEAAGIAYAKQRAWEGRELETLIAWLEATRAENFDEWREQAERSAINVNLYYADVEGNIGYFHGGHMPRRVEGHDNRLPARGDGSMDWQGRLPADVANPHVLNPSTGYLANWNNKPGQGVMNPDFFFYSWSSADRVDFLHEALESNEAVTADEAWSLIESSSYVDVNARYLLPYIDRAVARTDEARLVEANAILRRWNGQSRDDDADGYYDEAATAIFRSFVEQLISLVLADDLGAAYPYFSASGYPRPGAPTGAGTNVQPGVKAIVEALEGEAAYDLFNGTPASTVVANALGKALDSLNAAQAESLSELRLPVAPRPFLTRNFLGIPQAADAERLLAPIEQNRGTENNMLVFRPEGIEAWEVAPPGQTAFIGADGERAAHYADQFELYLDFGRKRTRLHPGDDAEVQRLRLPD